MAARIQQVQQANIEAQAKALLEGKPIPKLISTREEIPAIERLMSALRQATIEGERLILGITSGAIEKEDPTNGARAIVMVLQEARREFDKSEAQIPECT
jgi:hypothetical protein